MRSFEATVDAMLHDEGMKFIIHFNRRREGFMKKRLDFLVGGDWFD